MAEKTLATLRNNVERLGARLGENLAEHSRDLGLVDSFASGTSGGAGKYLENGAVVTSAGTDETKRMLGSKSERERTEGLKRVIAMMTKNLPVTSFFPLVTSLLSPSTSLQSRSLISLYIVHCASTAPELALLAINAYQKDLSDPNPLVRAGSIATLSQMALPDIRELVGMAVQKGARDTSWYVRRAVADALRVLYRADPTSHNLESLVPTLAVLLDNSSPLTLGAALSAWEALVPQRWELVHPNYRRWCRMLMDVDEWGQTVALRVLARYGRSFFLDPETTGRVDPDAELLLKASEAGLMSLNAAVVSATVKLHYYLSPSSTHPRLTRPLLRLLSGPPESAALALSQCALIAEERPQLFVEHLGAFFVRFGEDEGMKRCRLRVVVALVGEGNIKVVLRELLTYVKDTDDAFARDAVQAIGTCALRVPNVAGECLRVLLKLLQSPHESTVSAATLVLLSLIRSPSFPSTASRKAVITRLAAALFPPPSDPAGKPRIRNPDARATVYWLVGQYAAEGLAEGCGADVVRLGAKGFADEAPPAKLHLLTLSAKLLVLAHLSPLLPASLGPLARLFDYLALLARYDADYAVRDRARFLAGVVRCGGVGRARKGKGAEKEEAEGAKVVLGEEDFMKGVTVEDLTGADAHAGGENGAQEDGEGEQEQTMTAEQVRKVLFEGKQFGGEPAHVSVAQLGTLALSLPSKRPFSTTPSASLATLPPYPTSVPPSSIRDPPAGSASSSAPSAPMQGFGSDSLRASPSPAGSRPGSALSSRAGGRGAREKVVLVPTASVGEGAYGQPAGTGRRKVGMEEFFRDSSEEEETSEEEEESSEEEDDDEGSEEGSEEEEEDEGEEEETSSEDEEAGAGP
ncbi:hypothetical protein JCM10207_003276 [Rhodosporidiobolus poonsookiae]